MPDYDLEAINADWPKVNQLRRMTDPDQLIAWCARATLQFADPRILDDPPTKIPDGVDLQGAVEAAADNHIVAYLLDDDPAFRRLYSAALARASKKGPGVCSRSSGTSPSRGRHDLVLSRHAGGIAGLRPKKSPSQWTWRTSSGD